MCSVNLMVNCPSIFDIYCVQIEMSAWEKGHVGHEKQESSSVDHYYWHI